MWAKISDEKKNGKYYCDGLVKEATGKWHM